MGEIPTTETRRLRTFWQSLIRDWSGGTLAPAEKAAFADEAVERDIRRLRVLAPLMLLVHVVHIALYWVPAAARASMNAQAFEWHRSLVAMHAATVPLAIFLIAVAWWWPGSRVARSLIYVGAAGYLVHGALATGLDQLMFANVSAFTGYCFAIAVICAFPLRTGLWVYGLGTAVVVVSISVLQTDAVARTSNILNVATVVVISLALSWLLSIARQRDFTQRRTIARQRDELAGLNSDLERRVAEQVAEIIRRAEEVSQLNAQLRSQIRARSSELSMALARLAKLKEGDDKLRAGSVLGERFEIGDKLGAGAMGEVYAGRDRATGAKVAIKVIHPTTAIELDAMRRFVGEAAMVAAITHPAVVRMIHVDLSADGFLYQAQELLEGETLEDEMQGGPWPQARVARFGEVLCDALAAAHVHGVIHRDVKPANVMLIDKAPGLKLLDFGLAKLFENVSADAMTRTSTGLVVGTPAYMAPEQVMAQDVTGKADVYSSGLLLFQLLAGRLVFEVDGASRVMMSHVAVAAPDVRSVASGVSEELARLIGDCLAKDPAKRPSAADASRRLREFADAQSAPALEEMLRAPASSAILRRFH